MLKSDSGNKSISNMRQRSFFNKDLTRVFLLNYKEDKKKKVNTIKRSRE